MAKYLFKSPVIFLEDEEPGFDDDGEEDVVGGSGHGGYFATYEAWMEAGYGEDMNNDGIINADDYDLWIKKHFPNGDPNGF